MARHYLPADFSYLTVDYIRDVEYIRRGGTPRYIQIFKPSEGIPGKTYPLVIHVQGSAFHEQEMYRRLPQLVTFARRGYVVASVQYRGSELARFPALIEDVKAGVRYMCAHAHEYAADPDKLIIWGDSSGGTTATLVGITSDLDVLDAGDYPDVHPRIRGIINWYGASDLRVMLHAEPGQAHPRIDEIFSSLFGPNAEAEQPDLIASSVLMHYISRDREIPPILMFHGDADVIVPHSQSELLYDALVAAGKDVDFYTVSGAQHGGAPFHAPSVTDLMDDFIRRVTQA